MPRYPSRLEERTDRFKGEAIERHGNKYTYLLNTYVDCKKKMTIICDEHGPFRQTPDTHLSGSGCPNCANISRQKKQKSTPEQFINLANSLHNSKYKYPNMKDEYINAKSIITIICPVHGEFSQKADNHVCKRAHTGCNACALETISDKLMRTQEEYLELCHNTHGFKYNYELTKYTGCHNDIEYECPEHGIRIQLAQSHIKYGCWDCAVISRGIKHRNTTEEFIRRAKEMHGDTYTYGSNCIYKDYNTPVQIICKVHGMFEQTPACHLRKSTGGGGCIKCTKTFYSKGQLELMEYYKINNHDIQYVTNGGEHRINGTRYHADGYIPSINQVIEFHGCYFHGCNRCYKDANIMNKQCNKPFAELYENTKKRGAIIISLGYKFHEIWQCDWKRGIKALSILQNTWRNYHY